jgi:hypothetical protein
MSMILFVGMLAVMFVTVVVAIGVCHKEPPKIKCQVPVFQQTCYLLKRLGTIFCYRGWQPFALQGLSFDAGKDHTLCENLL